MTIYHDCSFYGLKNMTARGGFYFSYMKKICYKSSCQNTTWSICIRNIIKVSNSLDPKSFGPNFLQMLSLEKTLARVKRSCQKILGFLKKNQHIWSIVLLYHDCSNYTNLSKTATRVICMFIHLFVCESVTATGIDQVWFNLGLYDTFKVLHSVTLANIKAGFR